MLPKTRRIMAERLKDLVPGYGVKLNDNPDLAEEILSHTAKVLGIHH